ncbi:MAG: hypothetical protein ACXW3D_07115 [Caulobacteraceae bacterium]
MTNRTTLTSSVALAIGAALIASSSASAFSLPSFMKKKKEAIPSPAESVQAAPAQAPAADAPISTAPEATPVSTQPQPVAEQPAPAPVKTSMFGRRAKAAPTPAQPVIPAYVPPSQVVMATRVVDLASVYAAYVERTGAIKASSFKDGPSVAAAVRVGQSFEPRQLQQGMIAYAAMVALRDPAFVNQMRAYAADPRQREIVANQLMGDPNYVAAIPGVDTAAGLVVTALASQGAKLKSAGVAVKQSAYDVQHQAWSKQTVANRDGRLAEVKLASRTEGFASAEDRGRVIAIPTAPDGAGAPAAGSVRGPYSPSVARGLALAGLAVLGKAGEENINQVSYLLVNNQDGFCLNMSKLNLYQCLSVAKPHYEDIFCLGKHVLLDAAECIDKAVGAPNFTPGALPATMITAAGPAAAVSTAPVTHNK